MLKDSEVKRFGLGRRQATDGRDMRFALQRVPSLDGVPLYRNHHAGFNFDQGDTSHCVAYSLIGLLTAGPVKNTKHGLDFKALYDLAQSMDEWDGAEPTYFGTSVRAGCKALKQLGFFSTYRWAFDVHTVAHYVLTTGPMVVGTNWHRDMFTPGDDGYIRPEGPNDGGHAYLLIGANRMHVNPDGTTGFFTILNSWGRNWGHPDKPNGRAKITFDHMAKLIHENGEAACVAEVAR